MLVPPPCSFQSVQPKAAILNVLHPTNHMLKKAKKREETRANVGLAFPRWRMYILLVAYCTDGGGGAT